MAGDEVVSRDALESELEGSGAQKASNPNAGKSAFKTERGCTDILFLIGFCVFWVGMFAIGIYAFANGDPNVLMYAKDYEGNICKGNLYYPEMSFARATSYSDLQGFCMDSDAKNFANGCPDSGMYEPSNQAGKNLCRSLYGIPGAINSCLVTTTSNPKNFRCMLETGAGCTDTPEECAKQASGMGMLSEEQSGYAAEMGRNMSAVKEGLTPILIVGGVGALLVSLFWMWLLGHPTFTKIIVWLSILGFFLTWLLGAGISGCYAGYWMEGSCECTNCQQWEIMFWITSIITVLFFCMIICMCRQIQLACTILTEASRAVNDMKVMLLFPLVPFSMLMVLYIWFCSVSAYLYGIDSENPPVMDLASGLNVTTIEESDVANMWWFHLFGLLWTQQLVNAIAMLTIAGAVSNWYFEDDKTQLGHAPVLNAFKRTMRYHLGSAAFGALLVAIIQFIRCVVKYIESQCKSRDNKIVKAIFCMIQSCLWCLEKCMKFLNKNAYIIVAMKGCMFCSAALEAIKLILMNPRRITAVSMVTVFVLNLGKLAVCAGCAMIGYSWLTEIPEVESYFLPVLVIVMLAYCVSYVVFSIYDKTVDTILLCVLEDEKLNKHTGHYFAPPDIRAFLAKGKDDDKKTPAPAAAEEDV